MKIRLQRVVVAACLGLSAAAGAARADEAISTAAAGAPPQSPASAQPAGTANDPEAIGAWARDVLAGRPTAEAAQEAATPAHGCAGSPDGKPHGEVWAGIGTRGYRTAGGVVTQPLGACGSLTVGVSRTDGGFGGWRR